MRLQLSTIALNAAMALGMLAAIVAFGSLLWAVLSGISGNQGLIDWADKNETARQEMAR